MAFLSGWTKRRKVTVSNTNIDSNLTHFPLLLTLGTSVGTGNTDVSSIFDELTSDANRTKIAFTKTDGTTELYAEIEKWDDANETAVIWISKSDLVLASGATTDVYMYYDSSHAANTTYIGDTNSVVAESVWDSNFKMVQHLADGASTSATYDSTSNDNDLTKVAANEPIVTTSGEIANAQSFDGSNDVATRANILGTTNDWTISALVKFDNVGAVNPALFSECPIGNSGLTAAWEIHLYNGNLYVASANGTDLSQVGTAAGRISSTSVFYHIVITKAEINASTATVNVWIDNNNDLTDSTFNIADNIQTFRVGLGNRFSGGVWAYNNMYMDGIIDEARVSNIVRSDAWIKANYYAQTDALVAWGAEEEPVDADVLVSEQALALTQHSPNAFPGESFIATALELALSQQNPTLNYDYALALSELGLELAQPTPTFAISITEVLTALGLELDQVSPTIGLDFCAEPDALKLGVSLYDPILFYWQKQTKHTASWTNSSQSTAPTWVNKTMH